MDPILHSVLEDLGPDQAFAISYHMSFPYAGDPFYLANPGDNEARMAYYNVFSTPSLRTDGSITATNQTSIENAINNRLTQASPVWLNLSSTITREGLEVTCTAVADEAVSGNVVLHMTLLDHYSYLPESPNGQPHHYGALLDFYPSDLGQPFSVTAYDTSYFTGSFELDPSWFLENLDAACFVQDNDTKEILQAIVRPVDTILGVEPSDEAASQLSNFNLVSSYPNPFNPATTISYSLVRSTTVLLNVFDTSGRLVTTLVDGYRDAGIHEVSFDASGLASGVYIYRLQTSSIPVTGKMVLMN